MLQVTILIQQEKQENLTEFTNKHFWGSFFEANSTS